MGVKVKCSPPNNCLLRGVIILKLVTLLISPGISVGVFERRSYFYSGGYGVPGLRKSSMDDYLNVHLVNFPNWVNTTDAKIKNVDIQAIDNLDTLPISNFSNIAINNPLFNLDMRFKDTVLSGFASGVQPYCVSTDFEGGRITVTYGAYNVSLSGNFDGNGTILNGTSSFQGSGKWRLGLQMTCTLKTFFNYANASHAQIDTEGDGFRFDCGTSEGYDKYPPSRSPYRGNSDACPYIAASQLLTSRFEGLMNSSNIINEDKNYLKGIKKQVSIMLGRNIEQHGQYSVMVKDHLGPLLHKYLAHVVQQKSVFEMLNFDLQKYIQSKMGNSFVGVVAF